MNNISKLKENICNIGKRLYDKGLSPGVSGNISIKHDNKLLITPSGMCLGELDIEDIVIFDLNTNCIEDSTRKPSSEKSMHIEVYKARRDLNCIIHAHPPKSTSFASAGIPLDHPILAEAFVILGPVPVAEYAMPSSEKLACIVGSYFSKHNTVLLANHGIVIGDNDLKQAYYKLETLELYAEISLWTKLLESSKTLSQENIEELIQLKFSLIHK